MPTFVQHSTYTRTYTCSGMCVLSCKMGLIGGKQGRGKKKSIIRAWHVGEDSDLMSILAASVECRQWLTKHFRVQGTVVLKENSDDLHLIAAKPRASARPARRARSDRLSHLPRVRRPYARFPPPAPAHESVLTKRRRKYDIQTSVPAQPEPSQPHRDANAARKEERCPSVHMCVCEREVCL